MRQPVIDYAKVDRAYRKMFAPRKGTIYRAVTIDGDIVDGRLTYCDDRKAEIQTSEGFRSFNLSCTKLILIDPTDTTY